MSILTSVVQGWTGRLPFTLKSDGSAINGTGLTPVLFLRDSAGSLISIGSSQYGWIVAASGTFYYDPGATDLLASREPYSMRVEVIDGTGKIVYYANAEPGELKVWAY